MHPFSGESVAQALASLSPKGRLAFALSCCERMYPNYIAFERKSGWGDPTTVRMALDLAWAALGGASIAPESLAQARAHLQTVEPETEDFDTILVSSALDAAASAGLVLQFLEDGEAARIVEIASLCRDTVDMFIQDRSELLPNDPALENRIFNHPLMQAELRRQHDDLSGLTGFSAVPAQVAWLRERWRNPSKSNIDQPED